jgi:hypothetical protein
LIRKGILDRQRRLKVKNATSTSRLSDSSSSSVSSSSADHNRRSEPKSSSAKARARGLQAALKVAANAGKTGGKGSAALKEAGQNFETDGDRLDRRMAALEASARTPDANWSQSVVKVGRFTRSDEL